MKRRGFGRFVRRHWPHTSSTLDEWRGILWRRVEAAGCSETALRPSRYKVIKTAQVDHAIDAMPQCLDVSRAHPIAEAHHVVGRWLVEDILKLVDRHIGDVGPVHKGLSILDEPLKDPTMAR